MNRFTKNMFFQFVCVQLHRELVMARPMWPIDRPFCENDMQKSKKSSLFFAVFACQRAKHTVCRWRGYRKLRKQCFWHVLPSSCSTHFHDRSAVAQPIFCHQHWCNCARLLSQSPTQFVYFAEEQPQFKSQSWIHLAHFVTTWRRVWVSQISVLDND